MDLLAKILITAVSVVLASYILPGVSVDSMLDAVMVAAALALLNAFLKPILIILTIPVTIFTLGLFLLVINAIIILIASRLVHGFHVSGFWSALLFSLVLSLIVSLFTSLAKKRNS
jgi:putative membrane protein